MFSPITRTMHIEVLNTEYQSFMKFYVAFISENLLYVYNISVHIKL